MRAPLTSITDCRPNALPPATYYISIEPWLWRVVRTALARPARKVDPLPDQTVHKAYQRGNHTSAGIKIEAEYHQNESAVKTSA